jgi:hypothetical protein
VKFASLCDDPDWFDRTPENTKHISLSVAQLGTTVPVGFNCFEKHAMTTANDPLPATGFTEPTTIAELGSGKPTRTQCYEMNDFCS